MSEEHRAWYHCGRCGAFFKATTDETPGRVCSECGRDPSLGVGVAIVESGKDFQAELKAESLSASGYVPVERLRKKRSKWKIAGVVTLLLLPVAGVITLIALLPEPPPPAPVERQLPIAGVTEEEIRFVHGTLPSCGAALGGFLQAGKNELRAQFILNPLDNTWRLTEFYNQNPLPKIEPSSLAFLGASALVVGDKRGIEGRWRTPDGRMVDAHFFREDGEWKVDWQDFARYSPYPWLLFLAGDGPAESEFRLVARERQAGSSQNASLLNIVLNAPRFGMPNDPAGQSPEFLVERESEAGKALVAAFEMARGRKRPFDSRLPAVEPEGMVRVKATVRRIDDSAGRRFEIVKISALHWLETAETGIPE